jgi:hypothetical protein
VDYYNLAEFVTEKVGEERRIKIIITGLCVELNLMKREVWNLLQMN